MRSLAVLTLLAILLYGCGETEIKPAASSAITDEPVVTSAKKKDVGDVEATVDIELTLDADVPGVTAEELRSQKQKLNMLTLTVAQGKPAELWLKVYLKTHERFGSQPVAVRGKLFREVTKGNREELLSFNTILDDFADINRRTPDEEYHPVEFRVDAIQGLAELPETMLVFVEAEVVISPMDTDASTIDPATYTGPVENTGSLLSNAVRINYTPSAPTPAAEAPAAETPAAETPAAEAPAAETPATEAPAADAPVADAPALDAPAAEAPAAQ